MRAASQGLPDGGHEHDPLSHRDRLRPIPAISGVYLVHMDEPYFRARHYLGYADDIARRIDTHRRGHGSPLLAAATAAGIDWRVVQIEGEPADVAARLGRVRAWLDLFGDALWEGLDHIRAVQALNVEPVRWIVRASLFARRRDGVNVGFMTDYWFPTAPDGLAIRAGHPPASLYIGLPVPSLADIPWVARNLRDLSDDWLFTAGFFAWYGLGKHGW